MARYVRYLQDGPDQGKGDRPTERLFRVPMRHRYMTHELGPIRRALKSPDWHGEYFDRDEHTITDGWRTVFYFTKDYTAFQFRMRWG